MAGEVQPTIREVVAAPGVRPTTATDADARLSSVTTAATTKVGDILVGIAAHDWGSITQFTTAGLGGTYTGSGGAWTLRSRGNTGASTGQVHCGVWTRTVTGTGAFGTNAGAQTITTNGAVSSSDTALIVLVLDGSTVPAESAFFDVMAEVANGGATATVNHVAPAVDPPDDGVDGWLLTVHASQKNSAYTAPSGMTQRGTTQQSRAFLALAAYTLALTGTGRDTATTAKTAVSSISTGFAACSVAFKCRTTAAPPVVLTETKSALPSVATVPPPGFAVAYGFAVNDGRMELAATNTNGTTTNYAGLKTADQANGDLTLGQVWLETVDLPVSRTADPSPAMLWIAAASQPAGTRVGMEFDPRDGKLYMGPQVGYGGTPTIVAFDPLWMRWWRIRLSGGNVLWDTSKDGVTWQNRRTSTAPAWLLGADISFSVETYRTTGTSDTFGFRHLNVAGPDPLQPDGDLFAIFG